MLSDSWIKRGCRITPLVEQFFSVQNMFVSFQIFATKYFFSTNRMYFCWKVANIWNEINIFSTVENCSMKSVFLHPLLLFFIYKSQWWWRDRYLAIVFNNRFLRNSVSKVLDNSYCLLFPHSLLICQSSVNSP